MIIEMSNPRLEGYRKPKERRQFAIDVTFTSGRWTSKVTYKAGILAISPDEFPAAYAKRIQEWLDSRHFLSIYYEDILNEAAKYWQPKEDDLIASLYWDAQAYLDYPDILEFARTFFHDEHNTSKARAAFESCKAAAELLMYGEGVCRDEILGFVED